MKKLPTQARIRLAAAVVLVAAGALGVASLPWRRPAPSAPPTVERVARGTGPLSAGAAEVPLEIAPGGPIAGFARLRYASEGVRDEVAARALVLSAAGCRVALVSVDLLLVPAEVERAASERLADLALDGLVVAATHTHAGPGGYWDDPLGERLATGEHDPSAVASVAGSIARAVRGAAAALVAARVSHGAVRAEELARNRDGGAVDARLDVVRVTTDAGRTLAEVVIFPAHPTLLGKDNRLISGDWPGLLGDAPDGGVRLFFQGAVGDQSVRLPGGGPSAPEEYAAAMRERLAAVPLRPARAGAPLAFAAASVPLPAPQPGASPALLRRAAANVLFRSAPETARVAAVRLGDVVLAAVPAEPVAEVGARWREGAGEGSVIVSLAGGYLGYVETAEVMARGGGESGRTYYGPELEARLGAAVRVAAAAVR